MSTLYVVATPIGNLEDISLRAIRILTEVKLIAAEDTRKTRKLLSRYKIDTPLTSYHEHNSKTKLPVLLKSLIENDIALVSDSGMPNISDPGHELISTCCDRDILIVPIPGPSIVPTALAISGLPTEQFIFMGFTPNRTVARKKIFRSVSLDQRTLVFLEAPHRLRSSLKDILGVLGDRRITICRELTKLHEEIFRGTVSQAYDYYKQPRGEFTLVLEGATTLAGLDREATCKLLKEFLNQGKGARDAVALAKNYSNLTKRNIYQLWLSLQTQC